MFNLSGSEVIIILILALVVLGPEKLPEAMRKAGRTWTELRKMSTSFQDEVRKGFEEPAREVRETAKAVRSATTIDDTKRRHNTAAGSSRELPKGLSGAESVDAASESDDAAQAVASSDEASGTGS